MYKNGCCFVTVIMGEQQKISIRFYDDSEVGAVLTDQADYKKTRNYWKYLKSKLKKDQNELVSATNQLNERVEFL